MNSFLTHVSPTGGAHNRGVSLREVNKASFDFKKHFHRDLLASKDDWWVVSKLEPWSAIDCMVVDSGENIRSSFSDFSLFEITGLFEIIGKLTKVALQEGAQRVIVGANINHKKNNLYLDKVLLRLHLHVVGFTKTELEGMKETSLVNLQGSGREILNYLYDPLLQQFSKEIIANFPNEVRSTSMGVEFNLRGGFDELRKGGFCTFFRILDQKIYELFPDLSYSFCLEQIGSNMILTISPRSVFGKGVLEAIGIILQRDKEKNITQENYKKRNNFFNKIKETISNG